MFNDERINNESGKIYRNGIIIATLVSLIYGILKAICFGLNRFFVLSFTEVFIIVSGVIIFIIGEIHYGGRDERATYERHDFYLKAGKIFIICALSGYALSIPFNVANTTVNIATNELIIALEVLGFIYFFWNFKSRDINFNYSFIAEDKKSYYVHVFSNIGKLAGVLAVVFSVSIVVDLFIHKDIVSLISIIVGYVCSVLGLAIEYLFISVVEKITYDEDSGKKLKTGTLIVFITLLSLMVVHAVTTVWYYAIAMGDHGSFDFGTARLLEIISDLRVQVGQIITVFIAMSLCYLLPQISESKIGVRSIKAYLILNAVMVVWNILNSFAIRFFGPMIYDSVFFFRVINFFSYGVAAMTVAGVVIIIIMLYGLHKECGMVKWILLAPIAIIAGYGVMIFLYSQSMIIMYAAVECAVNMAAAAILFVSFYRHKYNKIEE